MAAREHKVSRRFLLGTACAAPLARHPGLDPGPTRHPGLDPGPTLLLPAPDEGRWIPDQVRNDDERESFVVTKWDRALAHYRAAEAALAAAPHADDSTFDRLLGQVLRALRHLLRIPAPDLPALATKLDLLVAHEAWELNFAEPSLLALRQDARRLAASPRI